jgi:hypothetical protein
MGNLLFQSVVVHPNDLPHVLLYCLLITFWLWMQRGDACLGDSKVL